MICFDECVSDASGWKSEKDSADVVAVLGLRAKTEPDIPGLRDVWRRNVPRNLLMSVHSERPGTISLMFSLSS